jgi:hypothetical protein
MANEKHKRVLEIADDLDQLAVKFHDPALKEIAAQMRKLVTSKETSNESTTSTEGGESEGGEGDGTGGNGGNNPPHKPPFKTP